MRKLSIIIIFLSLFTTPALGANTNGIITIPSSSDVTSTAERLTTALTAKGLHIFIRIDHQAGARTTNQKLRPTMLFIFGNPKAGTPLMQCQQTIALDLPQKILIYEDKQGKTWISYNDPGFLAYRHNLGYCGTEVVAKINKILRSVSQTAAGE